ncbi:hypothetical protein GC207_07675 [bacterium]|nr:hypothetical protein [bacterium]
MTVFSREKHSVCSARPKRALSATVVWLTALITLLTSARLGAQTMQDNFSDRILYSTVTGDLTVDNSDASVEAGEPNHGGKPGGHSLWISWIAPTNGIVRFKTQGSGIDTLLGTYRFATTTDTTFDKLLLVANADDSEGFERESEVEFGVVAGSRYEVAVDGYRGMTGPIRLRWTFSPLTEEPPSLLSTPGDRSYSLGDPVSLTVGLTNIGNAKLKWYFNGAETGDTGPTLTLASMQVANVGRYKLRISVGGDQYFTPFTDLQINTEGSPNTLAQNKYLDSPDTPLIGDLGSASTTPLKVKAKRGKIGIAGAAGVVRGYNGSQIFSTVNATTDPLEPVHCNSPGGKSYWLVYEPPDNGTVTFDTENSSYDTVVEAYTFDGIPVGYADLISISCNDDFSGLAGPSRVLFPVVKTRRYLIAVDGVGGATGIAWLNYSLNTNQPPQAPALTSIPQPITAIAGTNLLLSAPVTGSPPMSYSWSKDNAPMPEQTGASLAIADVMDTDSGQYQFEVINDLGRASGTFSVRVLVPPHGVLTQGPEGIQLSFPTSNGLIYSIEESTNLLNGWIPLRTSFVGDGFMNAFTVENRGIMFFRIRVE